MYTVINIFKGIAAGELFDHPLGISVEFFFSLAYNGYFGFKIQSILWHRKYTTNQWTSTRHPRPKEPLSRKTAPLCYSIAPFGTMVMVTTQAGNQNKNNNH
jgi:hypothetical protein